MITKNSFKNMIFNSGLILLIFLTTSLILSSIIFIFHGTITIISAVISILFSLGIFILLNFKKSKIDTILGLILGIIIFISSIIVSENILDFASDSNWYHKSALGSLANGWNPIYEKFGDFANNSDLNITNMNYAEIFTQHYCKASWITGANVYCLTKDIESGKSVNLLMAYILFAFAFHYLSMVYLKWWQAIIIGGLIVYNPLTVSQISSRFTNRRNIVEEILAACYAVIEKEKEGKAIPKKILFQ